MSARAAWESFYVIVGSSGGALIGLQFVVITLIGQRRRDRATAGGVSAFGTPTVVHLTGALAVSALMSAPWPSLTALSAALGVCGVAGLAYAAAVVGRARRQTAYEPVLEDWIWYAALPCASYTALAASALLLHGGAAAAWFVVAAAALALLLIGIHNAWDTVTHLVVTEAAATEEPTD
jgi:hypothetical protein